MDLDAYVPAHQGEWGRLERAVAASGGSTGAEADELLDLYQRVATHLSVIRSAAPSRRWSRTCPRCWPGPAAASAGTRTASWSDVGGFFTRTVPGRALPHAAGGG